MVEKNELVKELMIAIVDTEQNVTKFDGEQHMQEDPDIFHLGVVKEHSETLYSPGLVAWPCQLCAYH
ncbi:hypothetical protein Tco_0587840 [Tanacetum coccineum]